MTESARWSRKCSRESKSFGTIVDGEISLAENQLFQCVLKDCIVLECHSPTYTLPSLLSRSLTATATILPPRTFVPTIFESNSITSSDSHHGTPTGKLGRRRSADPGARVHDANHDGSA